MDRSTTFLKYLLGFIVIISIFTAKYFNSLIIFLPTIFLTSILYQMKFNKQNNNVLNFEEKLINVSKFIVYFGILGYVFVRIMGFFIEGLG